MASRPMTNVLRRTAFPSTFFTSLAAARQTKPLNPRYFTSAHLTTPKALLQRSFPFSSFINTFRAVSRPRRLYSTAAPTTGSTAIPQQHLSLTQRMRQLSKEYGYSALGVYFLLTALDFPFCFLLVRYLGTEKIGHYEHIVIEGFWSIMPESIRQYRPKVIKEAKAQKAAIGGDIDSLAHVEGLSEGEKKQKAVSIWTELALAYAVHKSLIFIRVPLTAALTPKIVQKLRGWGFNIGKKGGVRQGYKDARENLRERRAKGKATKDLDD